MPRTKSSTPPAYRLYARTGQAVVTLNGKDFYLGPYGGAESREAYDRLIAEWLANGRVLTPQSANSGDLSVAELMQAYLVHVATYYTKNGLPTNEQKNTGQALRFLMPLYGRMTVGQFGPLALKSVRNAMIEAGHCRSYINKNISRIRLMFRWGVENELVPANVYHALQAVRGLGKGRSAARESEPVKPVPDDHVNAIRPHVSRQVWAIIQLQRLTGMRPGEAVIIRGCDFDTSSTIWEYRPSSHKMEHRNRERFIPLGPRSQEIVQEFWKPDLSAFLFSPADADAERRAALHASRKTPLSCGNKPGSNRRLKPRRRPRDRYTVYSYRRAIERGCDLAFPAPEDLSDEELRRWRRDRRWHPNQLRHTSGTQIRKALGLEAAQVWLGHSQADVTQIYAERNLDLARQIAARFG